MSAAAVAASVCHVSPPGPNVATQAINLQRLTTEQSQDPDSLRHKSTPRHWASSPHLLTTPPPSSRAPKLAEPLPCPRTTVAVFVLFFSSFRSKIPESNLQLFLVTLFGKQYHLDAFSNHCSGPCFGYRQHRVRGLKSERRLQLRQLKGCQLFLGELNFGRSRWRVGGACQVGRPRRRSGTLSQTTVTANNVRQRLRMGHKAK